MNKHLSNLLLALCLCTGATNVFAQGEHTDYYGSTVMQTPYGAAVDPVTQHADTVAQSFTHPGGPVESVSIPIFSWYDLEDRSGKCIIQEGGSYGPVVAERSIMISGINQVADEETLSGLSQMVNPSSRNSAIDNVWFNTVTPLVWSGDMGMDELATEFFIDVFLPPGEYTLVFAFDAVEDASSTHTRYLFSFGNCPNQMMCGDDALVNSYPGGSYYFGQPLSDMTYPGVDLAFRVDYLPMSTSVPQITAQDLIRYDGKRFSFTSGQAVVYDLTGKFVDFGSQNQPIDASEWPTGIYVVVVENAGTKYTNRYPVTN